MPYLVYVIIDSQIIRVMPRFTARASVNLDSVLVERRTRALKPCVTRGLMFQEPSTWGIFDTSTLIPRVCNVRIPDLLCLNAVDP